MPDPNCTQTTFEFRGFSRRVIEASLSGGDITSNGGVQVLRMADERSGLIHAIAQVIDDGRRANSCQHDLESLLRQRAYAMALGYEDLNDHETLREDLALQSALFRTTDLASASTLCRLENRADRQMRPVARSSACSASSATRHAVGIVNVA
ncbi:MAG: transposase [Gammaproteobacteria bacterium]